MDNQLSRLNTFVPVETFKKLKIVAAERGTHLHEAVDYLLQLGIQRYVEQDDGK